MTTLKLTVLDQTPVHPSAAGFTNAAETSIALAQACDSFGYKRYWVAEHHNSIQFAGPCPEILIARIASLTQNIRVGSGGVMISHYSPFKVAEVFNMLDALFPDRIDLAIGRAPGGDYQASAALAWPADVLEPNAYPQQAASLAGLLRRDLPEEHPWSNLIITPEQNTSPSLWMLVSGGRTAELAGNIGMNLALAYFIAPEACSTLTFENHQRAWEEAGHSGSPVRMLAVAGFCADTDEEAELIASTAVYRKIMVQAGISEPLLSPEEVQNRRKLFTADQEAEYQKTMQSYVVGTPDKCGEFIHSLANEYGTDEIAVVTVTHDFEARVNSYRLLATI